MSIRNLLLSLLYMVSFISLCAQSHFIPAYNDGSKITISNGDTATMFSVNRDFDPKNTNKNKYYYYFKNNHINKSKGSFTGKVLNNYFERSTRDGELVEQGAFKDGLKHGKWKSWFANGEPETISKWRKGHGTGKRYVYNNHGELECKQKWSNDNWILTRKYKRIPKKEKKQLKIEQRKQERKNKRLARQKNKEKSSGFFKRLFIKKRKDNDLGKIMPENDKSSTKKHSVFNIFRKDKEGRKSIKEKKKFLLFKRKNKPTSNKHKQDDKE